MTRKDYIKFAAMLKEARKYSDKRFPYWGIEDALDYVVEHVADVFKSDNGCFDKGKFLRACKRD